MVEPAARRAAAEERVGGSSASASGRGRGVRRARILGLGAGGALITLAVLIQGAWQLSPPVSRLATRAVSRSETPPLVRTRARSHPRGAAPGSSPVILSEVSAVNRDVVLDDDLAPSDWVELYNQSDQPVQLAGWRLVETGRPRRGWVLPRLALGPRAYLIVWASGKDRVGSAAGRRVNTRLTRQARRYHYVGDFNPALPGGAWAMRWARRVQVDVSVPGTGSYTLWMKARAEGMSGTVRVRVQGSPSRTVTVPGGGPRHLMIGAEGGVHLHGRGLRGVTVAARAGTVDIIHVALVRADGVRNPSADDRYVRHVHAGFRLGRGREGVLLVDAAGVVRDQAPAVDHPPTLTLQRAPGALAWQVGTPTPAGRQFHPGPDLARYPSLSPTPLRITPERPAGVEELRYTLDGGVPTAHSPRVEGPLQVGQPIALRLRGYSGGSPVTPIVSRQFWIGPPPAVPTLMLALDPRLIWDPDIGIEPNDRWRRQQILPDSPALGPFRLTRSRFWARERRQWIKPAHLLALDREGLLFDGRARVRRFTMAVGPGFGLHVRTREPFRPTRDVFGRELAEPGRSIIVDEDDLNVPAYDVVSSTGGVAPITRWGLLAVNGAPLSPRVLIEPVDDDFLKSRWGHARFDLLKGKTFAAKRGTTAAYDALAHRMDRGPFTAADLAPLIDLSELAALHFAALFLATGHTTEVWQANFAADRDRMPARIHPIGWDLDHAIREGPEHDTLALQRQIVDSHRGRGAYLAVRLVMHLLDTDPRFRQEYLRHAERTLNHVLTTEWWEARRQAAGRPSDPDRTDEIIRFFQERPTFLSRSLAQGLGLPPPRVVRVEVQGEGGMTIDGFAHRRWYVGHYFVGGAVELVVPPEQRGAFRHFTVNGRHEPGPVFRAPVTEDLEVVARFGD
jgi:hypothetical protein